MVRVGLGDMERKGGEGGEKEGEGGGGKGGGCMIRHDSLPANQTLQTQVLHKIFANSNRYQQDGGWRGGGGGPSHSKSQTCEKFATGPCRPHNDERKTKSAISMQIFADCFIFLKWRVILRNLSPSDPLHGMTRPFF